MEETLQLLLYPSLAASWGHTHCLSVLHNITFEVLSAQMPPPPPAGFSWWFSAYFQDPRSKARRSTRDVAQLVVASSSPSWQISFEKRKKKEAGARELCRRGARWTVQAMAPSAHCSPEADHTRHCHRQVGLDSRLQPPPLPPLPQWPH